MKRTNFTKNLKLQQIITSCRTGGNKKMNYKDITFCINKKCNKRSSCERAIENYDIKEDNQIHSFALFSCEINS